MFQNFSRFDRIDQQQRKGTEILEKNIKRIKNEKDEDFTTHMDKIKEKEKEKLQKTFEVVFGKSKSSIKENSRDMKKKIYIYGFITAVVILLITYFLN